MKQKAIVFIFIFSMIIYSNSLGGSFVWDDRAFVAHNAAIKTLANFKYFFTDPATAALGELGRDVYRPVTTLSYAIDYSLWGLNPFGYHLTNVITHALNSALAFTLLSLLFGNFIIAIIGALVFASHPVQTEAVSWISGRSSVLFMFFYLLSIILYIRSRNESKRALYWASVLFFAVSLFSKEMAVTLPLVLILYDLHFSKKVCFKERTIGYAPYFAVVVFFISVRVFLLKQVGQFVGWGSGCHTFMTMSKVIMDYIALLFWPVKLCAVGYDMSISTSILEPQVLFSIGALLAIAGILPFLFFRYKAVSFAVTVFFITLLPVLNIVPIKALKAERFLYLPLLGFSILIALIIYALNRKFNKTDSKKINVIMLIPILLIGAYSIRTVMRNEDWTDEIRIGRAAFEAYPTCAWSITTLGENYLNENNYGEAMKYLELAVVYARDYDLAHYLLGTCYMKLGRYPDAVKEFRRALEINPDSGVPVYNYLGAAYAALKAYRFAEKEFRFVVKKDPSFANARLNLGRIYEAEGNNTEALKEYSRIILYSTNSYDRGVAYMRMGDLYAAMSTPDKARPRYLKAIKEFGPGLEKIHRIISEKLDSLPK